MGLYDDILTDKPAPQAVGAYDDILKGSSTISQETAKAVPRVLGGIAQEAGEAVQYLTGDRLGKGLRNWGAKTQADNAMTPGFVAEHPVLAEVGSAAEGVAKMAPYIAAETALNASPAGRGLKFAAHTVLPVVLGASQGERSYESGVENGLSSDEAVAASRLPAAVTGVGMAAMGPAVGGVRKLLPKAMEASTARAVGKSLMSSVLPDLAAGTVAGTAVMQAQGVATALAEKATGARPDADPVKEIIANPKAWLSAALTGGMFEALSLPGKLAHGEGVKAALNHPEIPKATKAQIILGTAEEIKKTDPEAAATYRATELEKLHKGEELDTAPLEALLPKEPEKAPPIKDQKEEIINAIAESLGLEDQSPLDVLQGKEAEKSAAHIEEKLAPHAAEAAEVAKSPEERAAELIQRGQLVIRRGEGLDPAVEEALAAEGKMLKDLGPELTGSIPRHRFEIVDIPLEEVPDAARAEEAAGAEPVVPEAERAVQEEAAAPPAAEEVKPEPAAPIANGEQRLAYEGNENLVVARKDDRIALIDQKEGKLLGLAAIRKNGKLGAWEEGKEPATPQERVEIERAFRQHLGEEPRLNRVVSLADQSIPKAILNKVKEITKERPSIMKAAESISDLDLRKVSQATWKAIDADGSLTKALDEQQARLREPNNIMKRTMTPTELAAALERRLNVIRKTHLAFYIMDGLRADPGRFSRTPSPDEIRDAKAETVKRLADQKGLEAEAQRQGITVDDLSSRLEVQLAQYNKILNGEATYAEFQAPLEAAAIKTHLDPIIKKLKTPVEIVGSAKEIPGINVDTAFSGAYHDGKIYLNAEHLGSLKEAERVLVEHEIAHSGLRGMLGENFDSVMAKAWADQADAIRKFAAEKGIDITSKAGKLEATEEYVVSLAEHGTKNSVWERFTATVKEWLRKAGFDLKFSDAELRSLVLRARASEMEGGGSAVAAGEPTRFNRIPDEEAPKKTVTAYKMFRVDPKNPDKLYPLFVNANQAVPIGQWIKAEVGPLTENGKVKSKLGPLAYRPGWHGGDLPIATHIGEKAEPRDAKPSYRPNTHVWAEVEMPADVDWQTEANKRGTNAAGKLVPVKAHITDQLPEGGHYRYKTNANMTGNWLIAGAMKVKRVLTDAEVKAINDAAGAADLPRRTPLGDDVVTKLNGKVNGGEPRFNRVATPEAARSATDEISKIAFNTGAVLKHLGDKVFRFVFPEDRIIKAALGTFRFNPIHEQLGNLSEYKQRMAGAATDILHAVHTNGAEFKKLFKTEELQDKAARLAFLESVYQLNGSAPLAGQWTPETREIPDTHPNAPEDATREVQGNEWSAPNVKGFAEAQTIEEAYREIRTAMAELNPQQLKAIRGLQDHIREADTLRLTALKEKNNFLFGEGSEEALAANARIDEVSRLAGRYMPLTRFGDHLVRVYEGPDGDHVRTQSFESRSGAVDYVAQMRDQGKHAVLEVREPHDGHAANIPASFLDRVQKAAEANGLTGRELDNFIAEYKRQWASTLPDSSLRANEVRRSNMAGFDTNLLRVYEHHMQKFANAVPKIRYGVKIEQTFRDMRNNIKTMSEDQASDTRLVQEMYELHNALYERQHIGDNERINPLVKMLNKGVFLNYLASPSVWLVQWSQPFMITLPKLAARHGAVSSTAEFNRAAKEYLWGKFSDEKIQAFDQAHGGIGEKVLGLMDDLKLETRPAESRALRDQINGIYEGLSADERSLLVQKMMILRGGNDLAFSHDVADEIAGASKLDRGVNKLVEAGGIFMRKSETGSRRAANLAAFKLEYGKSRDFAKASDYAMSIIDDTLYNFDSENRAGWMRGNAGRLLGMFQYFRLHTVAKEMQLVRDAIGRQHDEAIKAANGNQEKIAAAKAAKLEARKELAWQMAATMTFAGAAGTPLAMMASNTVTDTLWSALQFLFGDPDDPITLGQMAEAKAKEMFGETAGNALSRGVFSLADIDVSRRIGMGGMANLVPGDPPPGLSGSRRSEWYAARILGPTWGMLTDQMRAMEAYSNGDTGQAMQYASPKILKDMLKAYDINEEGVHSATGKTILPPEMVTPYAVALQMVGINPMDVTLAKEEAREISNLSTLLTNRRSGLVSAFQKAQERGDFEGREEALEAISAWGQKNPKLAISQKELAGAVRKAMDKKAGKPTKKEELAKEMLEKAGE